MSTLLSALETQVRYHLGAPSASDTYWASAELVALMNTGAHDLWRSVVTLGAKHICTLDTTNVYLAASGTSLTGVPADCAKVNMLEPRDMSSSGASRNLQFVPLPYNDPKFQAARSLDAIDPSSGTIYWDQIGAGGPIAAPTVVVAPMVSSQVLLALTYAPVLGALTAASTNPIPGESDQALIAWTVAYARAKEREDRGPDPNWLAIYATEKQNILVALTPRQDQESQVATAYFEELW